MDSIPDPKLLLILKEKLAQKVSEAPFDEKLADQVLVSNDPTIFALALSRPDCPAKLITELALSPGEGIRKLIVAHANTPLSVLRGMVNDKNPEIAVAAKRRLSPGVLIVEPEKFNRH